MKKILMKFQIKINNVLTLDRLKRRSFNLLILAIEKNVADLFKWLNRTSSISLMLNEYLKLDLV